MNRIASGLLYAALLLGGTYAAFRPTFDSGFARMQTDLGDTVLNHYILEHTWQAVSNPDYRGTLLSPPYYYPQPLVIGYSENFLGVAPAYWALRLVLPYDLAFQWWTILMSALNFVAFAAVARWLGCPRGVAAFGGFLWAFGLVHVYQLRHQQMIPRFWCPVALYHAWGLVAAPNVRSLNRLCGAIVLQSTACVYTGWFLVLGTCTFVAAAARFRPGGWAELRQFLSAERRRIAPVLGLWGGGLAVFFLPYLLANRGVTRGYLECRAYAPTASCWVCGPEDSRWFRTIGPWRESVCGECALFCGLALLSFVALAAWQTWAAPPASRDRGPRALVAGCLAAAGALVLLTLDFGDGASGWFLVRMLPGGGAIRVVARVYVPVYLFADAAAVLALTAVLTRLRSGLARGAVYALMGFAVFEQLGHETDHFDKADFYPLADECAAALRGADVGFVSGRYGCWGYQNNLLGMWAGLRANVPVVNGYSGRAPDGYDDRDILSEDEVRAWLAPRYGGRLRIVDPRNPSCPRDEDMP